MELTSLLLFKSLYWLRSLALQDGGVAKIHPCLLPLYFLLYQKLMMKLHFYFYQFKPLT